MEWGFLRETTEMALAAGRDEDSGVCRTGLDQYLSVIFPEVHDWVHDKSIGKSLKGKSCRCRPDYRSDSLRMIIEFDGLQHYTNPLRIRRDVENQRIYELLGYQVVRIPYFIQLTNAAVEVLFGRKVDIELFDGRIPSMGKKGQNTPAFVCLAGLTRMAKEFSKFPDQYKVNLQALKRIDDEFLSGAKALEREYGQVQRSYVQECVQE